MDAKDKQFIRDHPTMPVEEIARRLSLKEKKIRHFLDKQEEKRKRTDLKDNHEAGLQPKVKPAHMIASLVLILALGFLVYAPSLQGTWIWDDNHLVKDNILVHDSGNIGKLFSGQISSGRVVTEFSFYRPLQMLSYMADHALWQLDTTGYHLTNIVLHCVAAAALYWLVILLFQDGLMALFCGLLFVVHPLHSEAIAYIAGRSDPLAGLFILLSMVFYLKNGQKKSILSSTLTIGFYIGALLSREASLILIALIGPYHVALRKKSHPGLFVGLLIVSGIYIFARSAILGSVSGGAEVTTTLTERIPGFFAAVGTYLKLLVLPFSLHMEYGNRLFKMTELPAVLGLLAFVALLVCIIKFRKKDPFLFFALTWFLVALLPQANLFPINAYMAEHWLYIPSIGIFLILAKGFSILFRKKEYQVLAVAGFIGLTGFFGYLTWKQNAYWMDPVNFYVRTLQYAPENWRVQNNLGIVYKQRKEYEKARDIFEKAIALNPKYPEAYNNLGLVFKATGNIEQAVEALEKAVALDAQYSAAYNNLGSAYVEAGQYDEAGESYRKAVKLNPQYASAYNNYGILYYQEGDFSAALAMFQKALSLDPGNSVIYNSEGSAYLGEEKYEQAILSYQKAAQYDANNIQAITNLGKAYQAAGRMKEAIISFNSALKINPNHIAAYYSLGQTYEQIGQNDQAITAFTKVTELKPDYANAFFDLARVYAHKQNFSMAISYSDKAMRLGYKIPQEFLNKIQPYRK